MCIHSKKQMVSFISALRGTMFPKAASVDAVDSDGDYAGVEITDATNDEKVAEMVSNLKVWHPGCTIDLSDVNEMRAKHGLYAVDEDGLPISKKPVPETYDHTMFDEVMARIREMQVA